MLGLFKMSDTTKLLKCLAYEIMSFLLGVALFNTYQVNEKR